MSNVNQLVSQDLGSGFPQGLKQRIAPFSGNQNLGINNLISSGQSALGRANAITPGAQSLANLGASTVGGFAGGSLGSAPNAALSSIAGGGQMNPYLGSYFNALATPLTQQYQLATNPALMAEAQQAGAFNSPGFAQEQGYAQAGLGQSLSSLGAQLAAPMYTQSMQDQTQAALGLQQNNQFNAGQQLAAAQGMPAAVQGLYQPANSLASLGQSVGSAQYGAGSAQQQQAQNILNAQRGNTAQQINYPFALLSQLGGALGQAALGGGTTVATGPAQGGGK